MCGVKVGEKRREEHQREWSGKQQGVSSSGTSPGQISGCFFANAGVGSSDDDRFPIQPLLRRPAMAARIAERNENLREGVSNIRNIHQS